MTPVIQKYPKGVARGGVLWEGADLAGPIGDAELAAGVPEGLVADAQLCRRVALRHAEVLRVQD